MHQYADVFRCNNSEPFLGGIEDDLTCIVILFARWIYDDCALVPQPVTPPSSLQPLCRNYFYKRIFYELKKLHEWEKRAERSGNAKEIGHFDYLLLIVWKWSSSQVYHHFIPCSLWMKYRKVSLYGTLYRTAEWR